TPGTAASAFSTRPAHDAQVIPSISSRTSRSGAAVGAFMADSWKAQAMMLHLPIIGGSTRGHRLVAVAVDQRLQRRVQRHPVVEHETAAVVAEPADLLEVAEDPTVKLQQVVHAIGLQVQRGLFAADATGAEADHGGVGQFVTMRDQR